MPTAYKAVTVTLPASLWEQMIDSLDMELANRVLDAVKRPITAVVKALVKDAIEVQLLAQLGVSSLTDDRNGRSQPLDPAQHVFELAG